MNILTALKDKAELFTISRHMTRDHLMHLRNTSQFTCPQCENPLRLKIGKVVIPHFAHIVMTNCFTSFSERESPKHLSGKQQLADCFTRAGCEVVVEAYLPNIAQRPDLLIRKNKKTYAIEFQCSVMSLEEVIKRNQGYKKIGLPSIWLLSTPPLVKESTSGVSNIKLSKFTQSFMESHPISGDTIITYDPETERFIYLSHLLHLSGTGFIAKVRSLSIAQQTFPFAQVKPLSTSDRQIYWSVFQQKRTRYLRNRIFNSKYGAKDRFLKYCYERQVQPENLPQYIGFPIEGSHVIKDHPVEWQLALLDALGQSQSELKHVNKEWIKMFIDALCKVTNSQKAYDVVVRYWELLLELDYDIDVPFSQQHISHSELFDQFHNLMVAKRCEN